MKLQRTRLFTYWCKRNPSTLIISLHQFMIAFVTGSKTGLGKNNFPGIKVEYINSKYLLEH